ncbi:MAG: PfkB family carbohydrate kinase [Faecousia sp.]
MGIVVIGAVFVDIKGFPEDVYIPAGRNVGRIEQIHGGVGRNVAEDIANVELRPTFVSLADDTGIGADVVRKLKSHKVNVDHIRQVHGGMGTWLAVFDNKGDVVASISQRPDMSPLAQLLDEQGDEIFSTADSIVIEIDLDKDIVKRAFKLAEKYHKPIYTVVANMSIAVQRRDFLQYTDCFICNRQEAGILFSDDYTNATPEQMRDILSQKVQLAQIPSMIVTLGDKGAVYADKNGGKGHCPARNVVVRDTTGAGDAFCAGAAIGLSYGKTLAEACEIGSYLAASVIMTTENVCPRFLPRELGLDLDVQD